MLSSRSSVLSLLVTCRHDSLTLYDGLELSSVRNLIVYHIFYNISTGRPVVLEVIPVVDPSEDYMTLKRTEELMKRRALTRDQELEDMRNQLKGIFALPATPTAWLT